MCNGSTESGESGKRPHFDIVMIDESLGYMGSPGAISIPGALSPKPFLGVGSNGFGGVATATAASSSSSSSSGRGNSGKGLGSHHIGSSSSGNGHGPTSSLSDDHHVIISISSSTGEGGNATATAGSSNGGISFKSADSSGRSVSSVNQANGFGGGSISGKANSKASFGVGALVTIIRSVFGNSVFLGCTAGISI